LTTKWTSICLVALCLGGARAQSSYGLAAGNTARTAAYFESIRDEPVELGILLREMPKGGDLHNHIDGAVYAESFLKWAALDGLCVSKPDLAIVPAPCDASKGQIPAAAGVQDEALYTQLVDALSMKDFVPGTESGHDHFFATFAKFSPASAMRAASMLAEVANRAGAENVSYLELMWSPGMFDAAALGEKAGWDGNPDDERAKIGAELVPVVAQARQYFDDAEQGMRQLLGCGTPAALPGCRVTIRYQAQVIRTLPTAGVFAEILYGYMLADTDPRVPAVNLVAPEDNQVALDDYETHMRMLRAVHQWYPGVKLSLHAGELTLGLVPPEDLRFHIRDAVEVAGANRIGHGVDIMYEDNAPQLMAEMAQRHIMVEINLTSNDEILGVSGDAHPFQAYRAAGVPVALSTDDEGVSRIDLTHEFTRAVETYDLTYPELKTLVRNSLEYAFLAGPSLWQSTAPFRPVAACAGVELGTGVRSGPCHDFLVRSDHARLQWLLEASFRRFEATRW